MFQKFPFSNCFRDFGGGHSVSKCSQVLTFPKFRLGGGHSISKSSQVQKNPGNFPKFQALLILKALLRQLVFVDNFFPFFWGGGSNQKQIGYLQGGSLLKKCLKLDMGGFKQDQERGQQDLKLDLASGQEGLKLDLEGGLEGLKLDLGGFQQGLKLELEGVQQGLKWVLGVI